MSYDNEFYNVIRDGCELSASTFVAVLKTELGIAPETVIDIGCGEGWWAKAFESIGAKVIGVDGAYVENPVIENFIPFDLSAGIPTFNEKFDLAYSLEVAEHLPATRADSFIKDLCSLSDNVLFSAAIPGQGGTGHINEQWPGYWAERFQSHGFSISGAIRWFIWENPNIENWYRQNLLFATKNPEQHPLLFSNTIVEPIPVVHPVLWNHVRP